MRVLKRTFSVLMLTLLLTSTLALAFKIQPVKAEPKTWTVDDDGPADFHTIQEAINAPETLDGHTIFAEKGTYLENVVVNKTICLIGEDKGTTCIDGMQKGHVINVATNGVTITGFTITNSSLASSDSGIYLYEIDGCNITQNNIISNNIGVYLEWASSNNISRNNITENSWCGIYLSYSSNNNVISLNNLEANNWYGIGLLWFSDINDINGNNITKNYYGIGLGDGSSYNAISRNNIANNSIGIGLRDNSNNNTIFGNNIEANNQYGVYFYHASHNKLYHNNFISNPWQVYDASYMLAGVTPSTNVWDDGYPSGGNYWSNYNGIDSDGDGIGDTPYIIDENNQDSYPLMHPWSSLPVHNINTGLGYATIQGAIDANETLNGHSIFAEAGTYYEDIVVNKSLTILGEIKDTTFVVGSPGSVVFLVESDNVQISGFTMQNGNTGVQPWAQNATINDNIITNSTSQGIQVGGTGNTISRNLIVNCGAAIIIYGNNHTIEQNVAMNNEYDSIVLYGGSSNKVRGNAITSNKGDGIYVMSSDNNTISGNSIANNERGIALAWSEGNLIFHNNFINNTEQVFIDYGNLNNTWHQGHPSGGNYWSNYTGVDLHSGSNQNETGSDGIGDTPHVIDESNTDRYPLMAPYSTFEAGTWNETPYDVDVVSNSTVSGFHFNSQGAFLEFNVTGQEGTAGFCRVAIPKNLLWAEDGQWIVLVGGVPITNYTTASDQNYTYLYFTYGHSTNTVQITGTKVIPEFPSTIITSLFMILTMLALRFTRRFRRKPER